MKRQRVACQTCGNRLTLEAKSALACSGKLFYSSAHGKPRCPQCGHTASFGRRELRQLQAWYLNGHKHQEVRWGIRIGGWPSNPPYFVEATYSRRPDAVLHAKGIGSYAKVKRVIVREA
jgi:glutaredoxin-related protein